MSSSPKTVPSFTESAATLGSLLRAPYQQLQARLYDELAKRHPAIRRSHSAVFRYLSPEGIRLTDLAAQAGMTKQSMAYLVDHLVKHGYVKTIRHPEDGRAVLVQPTKKGEQFIADALAASANLERETISRLGAANVSQLRKLLLLLKEAWSDSTGDKSP